MGLLVAGTKYRGEFEERLKRLMMEIKQADDIILFIDEVHTLIGASAAEGVIDAANIFKPALARARKKSSGKKTDWPSSRVFLLLDLYQEKWTALNKGNFKKKHWMELAHLLQDKYGILLTPDQRKNKWDSLRKAYKVERKKEQCTGAAPSTWEFFDRMSELLSRTPKVCGMVGDFDGEEFTDALDIKDEGNDDDDTMQEGAEDIEGMVTGLESPAHTGTEHNGSTSARGGSATKEMPYKEAIRGQRTKKRQCSSEGDSLGSDLKAVLAYHTDVVKEIEMLCIEADKERMQQALEMQLQMARILAGQE
ncbi:hypothetical protein L7F22_031877 [Adiantum nelumboides]|nr:hypothetical protein [Adiantum nelumboides]